MKKSTRKALCDAGTVLTTHSAAAAWAYVVTSGIARSRIDDLERCLAERDQLLVQADADLKSCKAEGLRYRDAATAAHAKAARLEKKVARLEEEAAALHGEVSAKTKEIEALTAKLAERTRDA